jgi:hypothetical protein
MSLFTTYLEAVQAEKEFPFFSIKPGDTFKVVRPKTEYQKSTTSTMKVEKVIENVIHYTWIDSEGKETKGKVSKGMFLSELDSGEAKRIKTEGDK